MGSAQIQPMSTDILKVLRQGAVGGTLWSLL